MVKTNETTDMGDVWNMTDAHGEGKQEEIEKSICGKL